MIKVILIPLLEDNYSFLLQDDASGINAIIDPAEANGIIDFLEKNNIKKIDYIINTHHHWDHINGNLKLKKKYGCKIFGSEKDKDRIAGIDAGLLEDDEIDFGSDKATIIETDGHTIGHICLYFKKSNIVFVGDTLFSMGCGRLFEGTAEQMWNSFEKLKKLPDNCEVYCAHEYTLENSGFCLQIMPNNKDLLARIDNVKIKRANSIPTIPTTIGIEKKTNILFMANDINSFADLRKKRDQY